MGGLRFGTKEALYLLIVTIASALRPHGYRIQFPAGTSHIYV